MRFWGLTTGGLLIWAGHFLGLYLLSSAADVARGDAGAWNGAGLVFSLVCLVAVAGLCAYGVARLRRLTDDDTQAFGLRVGIAGALIGSVGVAFQSMVLLMPT